MVSVVFYLCYIVQHTPYISYIQLYFLSHKDKKPGTKTMHDFYAKTQQHFIVSTSHIP